MTSTSVTSRREARGVPNEAVPGTPRRDWLSGLRALAVFAISPGDLSNSFEATLALAGPTVDREFQRFADSPVGRRLLAEEPRRDLNSLLTDRVFLASLPEDSLGAHYLRYLGQADMGSAEYFLDASKLEEKAKRFGWTDEQLWLVRRMANSHDLFHIMTGYDTDIAGEIGVISFTVGQFSILPLRVFFASFFLLKPSEPLHWARFVWHAYQFGRQTPSLMCVDYEAMLSRPLAEVRRDSGIRDLKRVHPNGIPRPGRLLRAIEKRVIFV